MVSAADAGDAAALLTDVPADRRVALVDPRFVGHLHALRLGLTDPRFPAATVPGALTAQPQARPALVRALERATAAVGAGAPVVDPAPEDRTVPGRIAVALEAEGIGVQRPALGSLVAAVPTDPAQEAAAVAGVAAVDDEAVRLRSAVKSRDGFFTTFCISPYSRYIARWCARRGFTPNQVTTASLITALIAAGSAATGTRGGYVAAGILLLLSFVLDCADGQLARYSLQYSTMGAWLDATFDRAKEYAYYAGLAIGAARGGDDVWVLALGAMVLQSCRHVVDFSFNEANHDSVANTSPTAALSDALDNVGWTVWVRRMIVLPIGERWAMIAVLTALTTPRTVFYALLIGCALAACYTMVGRLLRSVTRKARRTERAARALADLADSGPLAQAVASLVRGPKGALTAPAAALIGTLAMIGAALFLPYGSWLTVVAAAVHVLLSGFAVARPLRRALDWLVPPFFRAAEYVTILVLAARSDVPHAVPAAFGLVSAVAYHHYDTVYRIRGATGAPPQWLVRTIGGHEGRTALVAVLAAVLTRTSGFTTALTALAVAVALVVLVESIRFWVSSSAPAVHDEGELA
ncbi:CDP-alcohol phosphatidyltransferase family protein [Streptomyces sp. ISL-112]|uniref:DUF5941 domain-containing protein n=1 Tax=unclassified Streptomyces TaxID=2593676 RepID=UPI001BE6C8DF|nr:MULTISPECIES: DUF5941 domain-containing protein [unclassified Streptomyces]MBT2427369.1 CDP-alcohol phosphatidyltransferase family protein [Streptomyces sp. ISL-112]MBT2464404.1 CDP-alcohol phosphatidyltransferase family protein [Streptomyces sp. ISL-63]